MELLSPAGSWDALKAAVSEGADAVYFGAGIFNARRRAVNFREKELASVVGYCHERGVKAYLAANILVKNSELSEYFRLIEKSYNAGIDAVIMQEISFMPVIKESLPDLQVHVSTQAGVFNSLWKTLLKGADRVILPRELTLKQIREFHEKTGIPVEVFAHGALCYSISGQCLMSSFLGGRSGNRGLCAQPCRKRYNGRYQLSTRDLCLVDRLPEIAAAGVTALKIEGRLRSPEYAGASTALYRRALDSLAKGAFTMDEDARLDARLAFARDYTHGGMFKEFDITTPEEGGKRGIHIGVMGKDGLIKIEAPLRAGDGVGIIGAKGIHGDVVRGIELRGKIADHASIGEIVRLRINAHEGDRIELTSGKTRRGKYKPPKRAVIATAMRHGSITIPKTIAAVKTGVRLLVKAYTVDDAKAALDAGADRVYYNIFYKDFPNGNGSISPYVPRCLSEWNAERAIGMLASMKPRSVLAGDMGVASRLDCDETYLDISCNAFNDIDVAYYNEQGMTPVISPELSLKELYGFADKRFAVYAHGRIPLMTTKYILREKRLTDEKGYTFPAREELDHTRILNSIPLGLYGRVLELKKQDINEYLLDLEDEVAETVAAYRRILAGKPAKKPAAKHTLGNYRNGVD
ncbi:MAG: U32 family peptidase [Candidatus Altiarchaeota archaeon]|nr:U32 family peptidase [Candidatus Altiarchaeota archaeon]